MLENIIRGSDELRGITSEETTEVATEEAGECEEEEEEEEEPSEEAESEESTEVSDSLGMREISMGDKIFISPWSEAHDRMGGH